MNFIVHLAQSLEGFGWTARHSNGQIHSILPPRHGATALVDLDSPTKLSSCFRFISLLGHLQCQAQAILFPIFDTFDRRKKLPRKLPRKQASLGGGTDGYIQEADE